MAIAAPPAGPPSGTAALADAPDPGEMRKALRGLLAAFRLAYGTPDGVRYVPREVYDFLAGVRGMTGATNLSAYLGKPGALKEEEAGAACRARLDALRAACAAQDRPASRLADGFAQAAAALAALERSRPKPAPKDGAP
jgi:hypothetical protein